MAPQSAPHPAWCDSSRCTATAAPTQEDFWPGAHGQHLSTESILDLTGALSGPAFTSRPIAAWLSQTVAPWPVAPHLCIGAAATAEFPDDDSAEESREAPGRAGGLAPGETLAVRLRLDGPLDQTPPVLGKLITLVAVARAGEPVVHVEGLLRVATVREIAVRAGELAVEVAGLRQTLGEPDRSSPRSLITRLQALQAVEGSQRVAEHLASIAERMMQDRFAGTPGTSGGVGGAGADLDPNP